MLHGNIAFGRELLALNYVYLFIVYCLKQLVYIFLSQSASTSAKSWSMVARTAFNPLTSVLFCSFLVLLRLFSSLLLCSRLLLFHPLPSPPLPYTPFIFPSLLSLPLLYLLSSPLPSPIRYFSLLPYSLLPFPVSSSQISCLFNRITHFFYSYSCHLACPGWPSISNKFLLPVCHSHDNFNHFSLNEQSTNVLINTLLITGIFFIFADGDQVKELRETFKMATEYLHNCKSTLLHYTYNHYDQSVHPVSCTIFFICLKEC